MEICHKWAPIEDLPPDYENLESRELIVLAGVWAEQRDDLGRAESLARFNDRLRREWAIETGVLERVYDIDVGTTETLIELGIDASVLTSQSTNRDPAVVVAILRDHEEALEGLFEFVRRKRDLSASYVKELHALLTRNQEHADAIDTLGKAVRVPLLRGEYKRLPNNPVTREGALHEYCPPEHVTAEMDRLIQIHLVHVEAKVSPLIQAAWLHHRFSQIHPFQDGNGRVVRTLASLVFIRAGWFPLVITREEKSRYLSALERADDGELLDLIDLFSAAQRRAFVNALGIAREVLEAERIDQSIGAAKTLLERRRQFLRVEWERAKGTTEGLHQRARAYLAETAQKLSSEIRALSSEYRFFVDDGPPQEDKGSFYRYQIVATARALGYFADTNTYRSWVRLVLKMESQSEILISFHGVGHEYRGVLVASACFFRREESEEGERQVVDVTPITDEIFQINYQEDPTEVGERFHRWLGAGLLKGLELWRAGL